LHECVEKNEEELIRRLLLFNVQMEEVDSRGRTALNCFSADTPISILQLLIIRGADVNTVDEEGNSPLSTGIALGDVQKVDLFVSKGANLHIPIGQSMTALHFASSISRLAMIEMLVRKGANVNVVDHGIGRRPIHNALHQTIDHVRLLTDNGAQLHGKDELGRTVLHFAVVSGRLDVVRYILAEQKGLVLWNATRDSRAF
ncbi:ankyrin, partial [Byssothecium circinans]